MAMLMAPRPSTSNQHTSPRLAKGIKPKTKANAIPAGSKVSGTSNNRRSSVTGNHAAAAPHLAPANDPTTFTAFTNRPLESAPIGTSSDAMNLNASIHPNSQHAQSQGQGPGQASLHAQRTQQQQQNQQQPQVGGPPPAAQQQLQHPRSSSIVHQQQQHPGSPAQGQQPAPFNRPAQVQGDGDIAALQQQQFLQSPVIGGNDPRHPNQALQYLQDQYPQQTGPFPVAEDGRVLMATAHMQRPYPNIYNTPQSHSPASVSSPHDVQASRAMFAQPQAHMAPSMYGHYSGYQNMNQVQNPSYGHPSHSQAPSQMPSQSLLMSHQQQPTSQMQHPSHTQSPSSLAQQSPRPKLEPSAMPLHRSMDPGSVHQSPQQRINGAQGPPSSSGGLHQSPRSGGGSATSNAAPGPIPATTPVIIHKDNDGAQWISFEYSRDRVKMEYSIKCNVETVDLNSLDGKFKDDNCVYPRAMTTKDEYKGNRYGYETECNNVGWALASLNTCIRGKRGLIQRAVDSWRNSNSDTKLRSRRVRRQQKMKVRKNSEASQNPIGGLPSQPGMPRPTSMPSNVGGMGVGESYHGHQVPGSAADDGTNAGYPSSTMRPASIFSGAQAYPLNPNQASTSMAPPLPYNHSGIDPRSSFSSGPISAHRHSQSIDTVGSPVQTSPTGPPPADFSNNPVAGVKRKRSSSSPDPATALELYGDVRDNKRPKFILVEDAARNQQRVRVRVTLDQVNMDDVPDSYRRKLSVYPRAYFPMQFRETGAEVRERTGGRWIEELGAGAQANEISPANMAGAIKKEGEEGMRALVGKTSVRIANLNGGELGGSGEEGAEGDAMEVDGRERRGTVGSASSGGVPPAGLGRDFTVSVPGLTRGKRRREEMINELGVRMAWSQSRVFSGRILFLQKSLDAFRKKMSTTISNSISSVAEADETSGSDRPAGKPVVNPHFELRVGKNRWQAGKRKKGASKASDDESDGERH